MITINRIEAENFRSLGYAVFEPLVDGGMTAINGVNGAGKSSLLSAMLWALYGTRPDGVKIQELRRQGSEGLVRVVVEFVHDGQTIVVERGLKGSRDTAYMQVWVDGVEQAFGKIRGCEAWLVNRFGGLTAEGFMTAFVVRQKEIDDLVTAKPEARRRLIERLAGIDRMSTAVQSARLETGEYKTRLEAMPGSSETLMAAREALDLAQAEATDAWSAFETSRDVAKEAVAARDASKVVFDQVQGRVSAHRAAEAAAAKAEHEAQMAALRAENASGEATRVEGEAVGGSPDEVRAAEQALERAREAVQANAQARGSADQAVERHRNAQAATLREQRRLDQAKAAYDAKVAAAKDLREAIARVPADLTERHATAEAALSTCVDTRGALLGEHKRLTASLSAMEAAGDTTCCPTCESALSDPAVLIEALRRAMAEVMSKGKEVAADISRLEVERDEVAAALRTLDGLRTRLGGAEAAEGEAREQMVAAEGDLAAARTQEQAAFEAAEAAKAAAMAAAQQTAGLAEAERTAQQAYAVATAAARAFARMGEVREAAAQAAGLAAVARETAATARAEAQAAEVPLAEQESSDSDYRVAEAAASQAVATAAELNTAFQVAEAEVKAAEKHRDAEEQRARARRETLKAYEEKIAVQESLEEFRRERIASLAPELSEIATDYVARMTEGRYVAVELDEEFTPVVTDSEGHQRAVAWLSGGEQSAVALALRLAIGEVIAGTSGGLLWMDEPQTAMDAQRRPAMMSVIRGLAGRQPIIISHVTEATDQVDLVLEVVPDPEGGSTVVLGGTNTEISMEALVALDG